MTDRVYPPILCPGGTVICLATGPSLNQADCDYVRGKGVVIAINDAYRLAPFADILYSSDRRWWTHHRGVPSFKGLKFGIGSAPGKRNPFPTLPDVQVLTNTGHLGLEEKGHGLRNGRNSGFACLGLAYHLGPPRRVILLGYNMSGSGDRVHFFGRHAPPLGNPDSLFPSFRRSFDSITGPLKEAGVEVWNCTENSSLTVFPYAPLREVLPEVTAVAS